MPENATDESEEWKKRKCERTYEVREKISSRVDNPLTMPSHEKLVIFRCFYELYIFLLPVHSFVCSFVHPSLDYTLRMVQGN